MSLTPPVNASGLFTLAPPFQAMLAADVSYTCIAVRKFADIQKLGIDPFQVYYSSNGLTQDQYNNDASAGECIVTLRSNGGQFLYVPTSFVSSYPNMGGISYTSIVLGVNLGAIPNYVDLSVIKAKIANIVHDTFGVTPQIQQAAISDTKNLSIADHTAVESAREQAITDSQTDYAKYLAAKSALTAAQAQITVLENYIKANLPPQASAPSTP